MFWWQQWWFKKPVVLSRVRWNSLRPQAMVSDPTWREAGLSPEQDDPSVAHRGLPEAEDGSRLLGVHAEARRGRWIHIWIGLRVLKVPSWNLLSFAYLEAWWRFVCGELLSGIRVKRVTPLVRVEAYAVLHFLGKLIPSETYYYLPFLWICF